MKELALIVGILLILMKCLGGNSEKMCSSFCSTLGMLRSTPGRSCSDIYENNKAARMASGNYWIRTDNGTVVQVYCDMELECGGHKGGWMRVAQLDTTNGDTCPGDWVNNVNYNSLCTGGGAGCYSAIFPAPHSYSKICGQARGYQVGTTDAFYSYWFARGYINTYTSHVHSTTVNGVYVDGVSVTLGNPRKHVWTYAVGLSEDERQSGLGYYNCPCTNVSAAHLTVPVFVGNNYYCESGSSGLPLPTSSELFSADPLWDGDQCIIATNSCCDRPGQPWFFHQLPISEKQHLEARICQNEGFSNEAVTVEKLQLFVQ